MSLLNAYQYRNMSHCVLNVRDHRNHPPLRYILLLKKQPRLKHQLKLKDGCQEMQLVSLPLFSVLCTHTHTTNQPTRRIKHSNKETSSYRFSHVQASLLTLSPFYPIPFHCSFLPPFLSSGERACVCTRVREREHVSSPGKSLPYLFSHCSYQLKITVIVVDKNQVNIREFLQQEKKKALVF